MKTKTEKIKKPKRVLPPHGKKIRWVILGLIIFMLAVGVTLVLLQHFDVYNSY